MMVSYLKDVSNMLTTVSAIRSGNIIQQLQTKRGILNLVFAIDHSNYASYNSFQHVFLRNTSKRSNSQAFTELLHYGCGASSPGDPLSTIHGDLVT